MEHVQKKTELFANMFTKKGEGGGSTNFPFWLKFFNDVLPYFQCLNGIQLDFEGYKSIS